MSETYLSQFATLGKSSIVPQHHPLEQFYYYSMPNFDMGKKLEVVLGGSIESNKFLSLSDTVLIAKLNPRIPRVWLVRNDGRFRSVSSTEFVNLLPNESCDPEYLYYFLQSGDVSRRLESEAVGTTNSHVRFKPDLLLRLPVHFPDRNIQKKIARILTTLDNLIEKTEALIAKYQSIKQGMTHDLFTRGVDRSGKLRPPQEEAPHLYKQSPLGWIPNEWEVKCVSDIAENITSGSRGWAAYYSKTGPIFVRIANLTREHINFRWNNIQRVSPPSNSEGNRTRLQAGDVLVSVTADLGIIAVVPEHFEEAYINQHIALVRPREGSISPRWLGRALASKAGAEQFERLNDSGAKAGLNLPTVGSLLFPAPSKTEQDKITEKLDKIEENISIEQTSLAKYRNTKSGLMQDLLTGNVRVKGDKAGEVER